MRLPADRQRWIEMLCRTLATGVLILLAYDLFFPADADNPRETQRLEGVSSLGHLTSDAVGGRLHFALESTPGLTQRAWLAALSGAGTGIEWSGELQPIAMSLRPVATPSGGQVALIAAPGLVRTLLRDEIAIIDSVESSSEIVAIPFSFASGKIRAISRNDSAWNVAHDSLLLRRIIVFGKAGWETRFVVASLEEEGWKVDAVMPIAPAVSAKLGEPLSLDTSNYAVAIALDESAQTRAREIVSFAKSGGGVVIGAAAAHAEGLEALLVTGTPPQARRSGSVSDSSSRLTTEFTPLQILADAIPLEKRKGDVAVAARRVEFGRVVQIAYPETWRWRMQGSDNAVAQHRSWWSGVVSQVAYAPRVRPPSAGDPAPLAGLFAVLGNPMPSAPATKPFNSRPDSTYWLFLAFALLLTEWASRRLRGAR